MDALTINRLKDVEKFARDQSESPYNNSRKERHVKELFAEIANRIAGIVDEEMSYDVMGAGQTKAWPFANMVNPMPQAVMPLVAVQEVLKVLEARIRALEPNKELQQAFKDEVKK